MFEVSLLQRIENDAEQFLRNYFSHKNISYRKDHKGWRKEAILRAISPFIVAKPYTDSKRFA